MESNDPKLAMAVKILEGKVLSEFEIRLQKDHPQLWEVLQKRVAKPLDLEIKSLVRDAIYEALVAQTEKEVDLSNLLNTLVTLALRLTNNLLPLLL